MTVFMVLRPMDPITVQPNNLGATLLIVLGIVTTPAGVGILVLLAALALVREADGRPAFPSLSRRVARVKCFLRINRLA